MKIVIRALLDGSNWVLSFDGAELTGEVLNKEAGAQIVVQRVKKYTDAWRRETQDAIPRRRHARRRRA